jgi:predicted DNA binding CopG/RHH family protein
MKKKSGGIRKSIPPLRTDKEAEAFLEQDLSDYLHEGNFRPVTFEFLPKTEKVNLRIPSSLLSSIKKRALRAKMPYQRYIRHLLERDLRGE